MGSRAVEPRARDAGRLVRWSTREVQPRTILGIGPAGAVVFASQGRVITLTGGGRRW